VWEKYTSIDDVMDRNEQLEAENAELRQQMVDYDRIKAENDAYKALARIQDTNSEASYVSAFVIGRDPLDEFGGFTLDQGSTDGVAVNDAIISDRGYLLGVVVEVDATSCKAMTILHPSFNAAGVISRTRENGIITGSADYAADGQCVLTNLDRTTEARKGDQVITTGLGGVFPANLLVGTVQEVVPEQSGKSSSAVILPGADPRTVKHVFIVTEY
jgi:rod shape-determining protein MreC